MCVWGREREREREREKEVSAALLFVICPIEL